MSSAATVTIGEALVALLESAGVDTVFGIPGVHTIELYRGLAGSRIRHVTPRHEQGAAFMADGYARVTGRAGVCLLITGPGLSNAITAMAQARSDRVPMLVISGVNALGTLGRDRGHLHELPDQSALAGSVALSSRTLRDPSRLAVTLRDAFAIMHGPRQGPVHLEIPTDVMTARIEPPTLRWSPAAPAAATSADVERAAALCRASNRALILAGGGTVRAADAVRALAERLDAPVVSTINARGIMAAHALDVPASPSLGCVRELVATADLVLALGTEMGPTDYDMYERGALPAPERWIRVDTDPAQLARPPRATLAVRADAGDFAAALSVALSAALDPGPSPRTHGATCARAARTAALDEIGARYRAFVDLVDAIWRALPDAALVGDSTQLVYAGNLYVTAPRPGAWFNSASGYGTLGYAPPAAIGAWLGDPDRAVVCLVGDGGLQFSLAELGSARDVDADIAFVVWNSHGYLEIETAMLAASIRPIGVTPSAPDFVAIAEAYGLPARRVRDTDGLVAALSELPRPCLVEYDDPATI